MEKNIEKPNAKDQAYVGVMGYYGFGNVGDEAILQVLRRFLAPCHVIPIQLPCTADQATIDRLNRFDFLIFGGGGLYNRSPPSPFDTFEQWSRQLQTPIGALGIGVERLDRRYLRTTQELVERTRFFVVRDLESKRLITHPKVMVAPDLTFYEPLPPQDLQDCNQTVCGVNLRPARPGVEEWIAAISSLDCVKRALPFSPHPIFDDIVPLRKVDASCPTVFSLGLYDGLDLVIGTAFHSIVFAIQCGLPTIAISYHPKVRRLMEEVGLAEYVLDWNEWSELPRLYDHALKNRESIRQQMMDYTEAANLRLHEALADIHAKIVAAVNSGKGKPASVPEAAAPRVSVVLPCSKGDKDAVAKTIRSCLAQTVGKVEVIVVGEVEDAQKAHDLSDGNDSVLWLKVAPDEKALARSVTSATGHYLTCLSPGATFAEDAFSVLIDALEKTPYAEMVCADCYITHNDIIERKVNSTCTQFRGLRPESSGCFLVRQNSGWISHLRASLCENVEGKINGPWCPQCRHISVGLLYRPATVAELALFRSLIAYGYGEITRGQELFLEAISHNDLSTSEQTRLVASIIEEVALSPSVTDNPIEYVRLVFANLPRQAKSFKPIGRKIRSRLAMAKAFQAHQSNDWLTVRQSILYGIWNDVSWLKNRGIWSILVSALLGPELAGRLRRLVNVKSTIKSYQIM